MALDKLEQISVRIFCNRFCKLQRSPLLFFIALRSKRFIINFESSSFVYGKFCAKNVGIRLNVRQFDSKDKYKSVFFNFIESFDLSKPLSYNISAQYRTLHVQIFIPNEDCLWK